MSSYYEAVGALVTDTAAASGLPPSPYTVEYGPAVLLFAAVHLVFVFAARVRGPKKLTPLTDEETNPPLPQQQTTALDGTHATRFFQHVHVQTLGHVHVRTTRTRTAVVFSTLHFGEIYFLSPAPLSFRNPDNSSYWGKRDVGRCCSPAVGCCRLHGSVSGHCTASCNTYSCRRCLHSVGFSNRLPTHNEKAARGFCRLHCRGAHCWRGANGPRCKLRNAAAQRARGSDAECDPPRQDFRLHCTGFYLLGMLFFSVFFLFFRWRVCFFSPTFLMFQCQHWYACWFGSLSVVLLHIHLTVAICDGAGIDVIWMFLHKYRHQLSARLTTKGRRWTRLPTSFLLPIFHFQTRTASPSIVRSKQC